MNGHVDFDGTRSGSPVHKPELEKVKIKNHAEITALSEIPGHLTAVLISYLLTFSEVYSYAVSLKTAETTGKLLNIKLKLKIKIS